jgi:hypothetical protein
MTPSTGTRRRPRASTPGASLAALRRDAKRAAAALKVLETVIARGAFESDDDLLRRADRVWYAVGRGLLRLARARVAIEHRATERLNAKARAIRTWAAWRSFALVELQLHDLVAATWRALASSATARLLPNSDRLHTEVDR